MKTRSTTLTKVCYSFNLITNAWSPLLYLYLYVMLISQPLYKYSEWHEQWPCRLGHIKDYWLIARIVREQLYSEPFIFQHLFYVMTKLLISVVHVKKSFIIVFNTILAIVMFTFRYTFYVNRYICYCKFNYYQIIHRQMVVRACLVI